MEQSRLNSLSVICIERVCANLVPKNDIDKIINMFASRKGRASAFFKDLELIYESFWFEVEVMPFFNV